MRYLLTTLLVVHAAIHLLGFVLSTDRSVLNLTAVGKSLTARRLSASSFAEVVELAQLLAHGPPLGTRRLLGAGGA